MIKSYEAEFNRKIDLLKDHEKFDALEKSRKEALQHHTGYGFTAITSADFMDRIIAMPVEYISGWLDGKNGLEWTPEYKALFEKIRQNGYKPLEETV